MWVDKDGFAHVEDQYDPSTFAEAAGNADRVDWAATWRYRKGQGDDVPEEFEEVTKDVVQGGSR